jgi:hypothetical protein
LKALLACLVSSLVVGLSFTAYSAFENGVKMEMFGVMLIAFLSALAVAFVIGLPFRFVVRRLGKEGGIYYACAGLFIGAAVMIIPMVASRHVDSSLLKSAAVLAVAGFVAGWTFNRVSNP